MSRFEHWSRRKRGLDDAIDNEAETPLAGVDPATPTPIDVTPYESGQAAGDIVDKRDEELTSEQVDPDALLADPDTLDPNDDFKAYLAPGVSAALKRRALRRMFTASHYNVRDGLDDYDQDFTQMRGLSREVASTLRGWMNRLAEDTPTADDETASLASHAHDAPPDAQENDSTNALADAPAQGDDGDSTSVKGVAVISDPSRPTNGTV